MRYAILRGFVLLAIGIMTWSSTAAAWSAEPESAAAPKWEYRVVAKDQLLDLGKKDLAAGLNKLGDEGWELVVVEPTYIFKRPKVSPAQIEDLRRKVAQAQTDMEQWRDRVSWAERMVKKGFLTRGQLEADMARLTVAELLADKLAKELKAVSPGPEPKK